MSKSRLAPIKTVTLPRLELDGARCGARLARLVVRELHLPIERIKYWSDSTLTLQYIQNRRHRMKSRVANRVTEILESSEVEDWAHVPGNINPADLLTRGVSDPAKLMTNRGCGIPREERRRVAFTPCSGSRRRRSRNQEETPVHWSRSGRSKQC